MSKMLCLVSMAASTKGLIVDFTMITVIVVDVVYFQHSLVSNSSGAGKSQTSINVFAIGLTIAAIFMFAIQIIVYIIKSCFLCHNVRYARQSIFFSSMFVVVLMATFSVRDTAIHSIVSSVLPRVVTPLFYAFGYSFEFAGGDQRSKNSLSRNCHDLDTYISELL